MCIRDSPNIEYEKAEKIYVRWIKNSIHGYVDKIFVIKENKKVLGYITCKLISISKKLYGLIDLIAVDKRFRGKGIGTYLIEGALKWFAARVKSVYVATQASNIEAIRLYEKHGFRMVNSEVTLHNWIK